MPATLKAFIQRWIISTLAVLVATYIVPGIEYRAAKDLDVLAEIGLGLTDASPNYLSFGLSYYVR